MQPGDVMTDIAMKASLRNSLQDILVLFQENQPAELIADELVRSTAIIDAMAPKGELDLAIREAEEQFRTEGFWKSPPPKLSKLVGRLRAGIQHAGGQDEKWDLLVHTLLYPKATPADGARQ